MEKNILKIWIFQKNSKNRKSKITPRIIYTEVFTINPPPRPLKDGSWGEVIFFTKSEIFFFARFAREVIFFTKPQNFLPRFAREVIFFTKSAIFSRASRGEVIFFTKSFKKIPRFARDVIFFTKSTKKFPARSAGGTIFYKILPK